MFAILLEFRNKIQMKVQNEKIIIDRHVDDHFSNVLHHHFKSSSVICDVLIVNENVSSSQFVAPDAQYASVLESMMNDVAFTI